MPILKVVRNGRIIYEYNLEGLSDVRVGRDSSNDIHLQEEPEVSRNHLKITYINNSWVIECLSKGKNLFKNGEPVTQFELNDKDKFTIPGYEFEYLESFNSSPEASKVTKTDGTFVGIIPAIPTLVIYDVNGHVKDNISLSGNSWVVGREPSNSVYIEHGKLSRKHFEIVKKDSKYFIRDLGSANGSFLGSRQLNPNEWVSLLSGDEISVFDLKIRFVLRDATFEDRAKEAELLLSPYRDHQNQSFEKVSSEPMEDFIDPINNESKKIKIKPIRFVMIAIILLATVFYFIQESNRNEKDASQNPDSLSPFDKLTPEQKESVKQFYTSAQMFLQQGKYELARQEIMKLHQLVPFYEDSRQIEDTANQGLAMLQEKERMEAEEKERQLIEDKIQLQIAACKKILNPNIQMPELDLCLASVLEFNPEHPDILDLKKQAELLVEERQIREAKRKEYLEKVAQLNKLYKKALLLDEGNKWLQAIPAYENVVKSQLPDPDGIKQISLTRGQELSELILSKQAEMERLADEAYKLGDLKKAIKVLREGIEINQENQILVGRHMEWMAELRIMMMPIYQDSILEESVGDVDSAKMRWKKIQSLSLPGEDYFEKSKIKLKRYGEWK